MENVMLNKAKTMLKIVDFGLSNVWRESIRLNTHCGSPEYAAPELFTPGKTYGSEVDIWSMGVIIYAMCVGSLPFKCSRNKMVNKAERRKRLLEQLNIGLSGAHYKAMEHLSSDFKNLITLILVAQPIDRMKLPELMRHSWVTQNQRYPMYNDELAEVSQLQRRLILDQMNLLLDLDLPVIEHKLAQRNGNDICGIYNLLAEDYLKKLGIYMTQPSSFAYQSREEKKLEFQKIHLVSSFKSDVPDGATSIGRKKMSIMNNDSGSTSRLTIKPEPKLPPWKPPTAISKVADVKKLLSTPKPTGFLSKLTIGRPRSKDTLTSKLGKKNTVPKPSTALPMIPMCTPSMDASGTHFNPATRKQDNSSVIALSRTRTHPSDIRKPYVMSEIAVNSKRNRDLIPPSRMCVNPPHYTTERSSAEVLRNIRPTSVVSHIHRAEDPSYKYRTPSDIRIREGQTCRSLETGRPQTVIGKLNRNQSVSEKSKTSPVFCDILPVSCLECGPGVIRKSDKSNKTPNLFPRPGTQPGSSEVYSSKRDNVSANGVDPMFPKVTGTNSPRGMDPTASRSAPASNLQGLKRAKVTGKTDPNPSQRTFETKWQKYERQWNTYRASEKKTSHLINARVSASGDNKKQDRVTIRTLNVEDKSGSVESDFDKWMDSARGLLSASPSSPIRRWSEPAVVGKPSNARGASNKARVAESLPQVQIQVPYRNPLYQSCRSKGIAGYVSPPNKTAPVARWRRAAMQHSKRDANEIKSSTRSPSPREVGGVWDHPPSLTSVSKTRAGWTSCQRNFVDYTPTTRQHAAGKKPPFK